MKILLINRTDIKILAVRKDHIEKLKTIDKDIEPILVPFTDKQKIEKHLLSSEIIAGHSGNIPTTSLAKNLKWIHSFSAGVEQILTPEVINSKVIVTNVTGIHATPIAEHVIGFMLIFTRGFYDTFKNQQKRLWQGNQNLTEFRSKTVLVVGLGHIGTEVGRLANCFGAHVIGIKHDLKNKPNFVSKIYSIEQLDNILPNADFVVLSLPLTPETKHLFDINKFKLMKKSAVLTNIGRGGLIKENDLIKALGKKIIGGAALDVTEEEPLSQESKLWNMENVVITPHHSGLSEKYMDRAIDLFCLNLKDYLANKPLPNLVDKKRGY